MAKINELLLRAASLRDETALNSISPERAGGIMYDTLIAMNELWLQQGAALVISKIYASVASMEEDTDPVSDLTGRPIRPGMVVVIASSDSDNGSVYRYNGTSSPSWSLVGKIGNLTPVDSLDSDSTQLPLAAHQGKVLDGKISQLEHIVVEKQTIEKGWFLVDNGLRVGLKYDNDGLDFAKISQHAIELLKPSGRDENDEIFVKLSDFNNPNKTDDDIIKDCLDFCSIFPKRTILFDRDVSISKAILLPSHTNIIIDNVTIRQENYAFDNVFRGANVVLKDNDLYYLPETIDLIENIKIIGKGNAKIIGCQINRTIEHPTLGQQVAVGDYYGIRTHQVNISRCKDFEICGIAFSRNRGWCISFDMCEDVYVHDLSIDSGDVKNGDGIDFRCGCKHCRVVNLVANTSDDAVACTALGDTSIQSYPRGNYMLPSEATVFLWSQYKLEEPEALYIDDVKISNVVFSPTYRPQNGHGMICLSAYGSKVQNVAVNNFKEIDGTAAKESLIKVFTGYGAGYTAGDLNRLRFNDIVSTINTFGFVSNAVCNDVWINKFVANETKFNIEYMAGFTITNS